MSIAITIIESKYLATPEQIQALAADHYLAESARNQVSGTFLSALIATTQKSIGRRRVDHLAVLENTYDQFYAAVLKGVETPDCALRDDMEAAERKAVQKELQRRATFARTAAATLRAYVRVKGIMGIDAAKASKKSLRAAVAPPEPTDRYERLVQRSVRVTQHTIERVQPNH